MKSINKTFILLFAVVVFYACENNEQPNEEEATVEVVADNLTIADYAVEGMVCAMGCAATIEKDVVDMNGVIVSEVNYETGKAHFEFDAAIVSKKEIIAKIESIADGQYKVGDWSEESSEPNEEGENTGETKETITEVSLPSFEIPNLFTLLMDQI